MKMPLTHADLLLTIAKGDKGDPGATGTAHNNVCAYRIVNRWIRTV